MKRTLLSLVLVLLLGLSACGGSSGSGGALPGGNEDLAAPQPSSAVSAPLYDGELYQYGEASTFSGSTVYSDERAKIIRTASLYLQSTQFDAAVEALNRLVEEQGGYFQTAALDSGGYGGDAGSRYGSYTVRVPKEHFDPFLSAVGEIAHVASRTIESEDVGEAYYDAELRLATLETKHERLLTLLEKASAMEDIIALESALSEVEYEIQQYTSTLERYDGLIDFSTITIQLQEVARVSADAGETDGLGVRLSSAFSRGWLNFCDGLADFAVWAALHFVGCLIFAAVVIAAAVVLKKRRFPARRKKQAPPPPPSDPK